MFGKSSGKSKMNATGKFIMAAGRAVGNVKTTPSAKSADRKGNGSAPKSAPVKNDPDSHPTKPLFTKSGRTFTGKGDVKLP